MQKRPSLTLFRALRELRHPLAVLAMVFVLVNLTLPAAAAASQDGFGILCSGLTEPGTSDNSKLDSATCEQCCLSTVTLLPGPRSVVVTEAQIVCDVVRSRPPVMTTSERDLSIACPRGPPSLI